jgi:hypothetical protein
MDRSFRRSDPVVDDRITTLFEDVKLPDQSFLTTFGDKIFQTNHVNNSVTCYTINGEKLWEFNDASVLRQPCLLSCLWICRMDRSFRRSDPVVVSTVYHLVITLLPCCNKKM